jgi:hypothetical protein
MGRLVPAVPPLVVERTSGGVFTSTTRIGTPVEGRSQWRPMAEACNWLLGGGTPQLAWWTRVVDPIEAGGSYTFRSYCWPRPACRARMWFIVVNKSQGAVGGFATADKPGGKGFTVPHNGVYVLKFYELRDSVDDGGEEISNELSLSPLSSPLTILSATVSEIPVLQVGKPGDGERGVEIDSCAKGAPIYEADESSASDEEQRSTSGVARTAAVLCGFGQEVLRRSKIFEWGLDEGVLNSSGVYADIHRTPPVCQTRQLRGETSRPMHWAVRASSTAVPAQVRVTSSVDASSDIISIASGLPAWYTGTIDVATDDVNEDGWVRDAGHLLTFEHASVGDIRTYRICVGE